MIRLLFRCSLTSLGMITLLGSSLAGTSCAKTPAKPGATRSTRRLPQNRLTFNPWQMTTGNKGKPILLHPAPKSLYTAVFRVMPRPDGPWKPAPDPRSVNFSQATNANCEKEATFFFFRTTLNVPRAIPLRDVEIWVGRSDDTYRLIVNGKRVPFKSPNPAQVSLGPYLHHGKNSVEIVLADWCILAVLSEVGFASRTSDHRLLGATLPGDPLPPTLLLPPRKALPKPRLAWRKNLDGHASVKLGAASSDRMALFATSAGSNQTMKLLAWNLKDGSEAWSDTLPNVADSAADEERLYVLSGSNPSFELTVFDWKTGRRLWSAPAGSGKALTQTGVVVWTDPKGETVAADGTTGRELWRHREGSLQAVGHGKVFLYQDSPWGSKGGILLDLRTGRLLHQGVYNDTESSLYVLGKVAWSDDPALFYVQEGYFGAGVNGRDLAAVEDRKGASPNGLPHLTTLWIHGRFADTDGGAYGFEPMEGVVVAENWTTYDPVGFVGLIPQTGGILWQRSGGGTLQGVWGGSAVALVSSIPNRFELIGLRPWDGRTAWKIPIQQPESVQVGSFGRWLAVYQGGKHPLLQVFQ